MFWQAHAEANDDGADIYSPEFKDLFEKMMASDPSNRLTVDEVLNHKWLEGPVTSYDEIKEDFDKRKQIVDQNSHEEREAKRKQRKDPKTRRGMEQGEDGAGVDPAEQLAELDIEDYEVNMSKASKFFTTADPLKFMVHLIQHLDE